MSLTELIALAAELFHRPIQSIDPTLPLEEQGADSLDAVELLMAIEDRTGIYIPDSDVVEMRTLADLAAWMEENRLLS